MSQQEMPAREDAQSPTTPCITPENPARAHQIHIVAVVLRILAIYVFITVFPLAWLQIRIVFHQPSSRNDDVSQIFMFLIFILILISLLWAFSRNIASLIVGRNVPDSPTPTPFAPAIFQPVAISLMGVWMFANNFGAVLVNFYLFYKETQIPGYIPEFSKVVFNINMFMTLIGVALFFGARGLSNLFHRFQNPHM